MRLAVHTKGVYFCCYSPSKSSKWHLKLFEVSDARTGYVVAFGIYTGKHKTKCAMNANVLDPDSTQTMKVVEMLQKPNLLGTVHHVYMYNYYTSPDLFWEVHCKEVFTCETCRPNHRNLPKRVTKAKLKKGECIFRRDGPLLCFKWHEKGCYNADNNT